MYIMPILLSARTGVSISGCGHVAGGVVWFENSECPNDYAETLEDSGCPSGAWGLHREDSCNHGNNHSNDVNCKCCLDDGGCEATCEPGKHSLPHTCHKYLLVGRRKVNNPDYCVPLV